MTRWILGSAGFLALAALGAACPLLAVQVDNPSRGVLAVEHFRAYYRLFELGDGIDVFALLGRLAAGLTLLLYAAWLVRETRLLETASRARDGERFPVGWLVLIPAQVLLVAAAGTMALLALGAPVVLTLAPALLCAARAGDPREDLRDLHETGTAGFPTLAWSAALTFAVCALAAVALAPAALALVAHLGQRPVTAFLWTHHGPWQLLGYVAATGAGVGFVAGAVLTGLVPNGETGSPSPVSRAQVSVSLFAALAWGALLFTVYVVVLVPRYGVGQDLRVRFGLQPGRLEGRTVAWLDESRPAHRLAGPATWTGLDRVGAWLSDTREPSALTGRAAAVLAHRALWAWEPEAALRWLQVQQARQPHNSALNGLLVQTLQETIPTREGGQIVRSLTDPSRFAWPAAAARDQVAGLLARYGQEREAREWQASARPYGGGREPLPEAPAGSVSGRLTQEGQPLGGARVALFRGREAADRAVARDARLVGDESLWKPGFLRAVDAQALRDLYAVTTTSADGSFRFEALDDGSYVAAVRLPGAEVDWRVEGGSGPLELRPGRRQRDLGTLDLRQPRVPQQQRSGR